MASIPYWCPTKNDHRIRLGLGTFEADYEAGCNHVQPESLSVQPGFPSVWPGSVSVPTAVTSSLNASAVFVAECQHKSSAAVCYRDTQHPCVPLKLEYQSDCMSTNGCNVVGDFLHTRPSLTTPHNTYATDDEGLLLKPDLMQSDNSDEVAAANSQRAFRLGNAAPWPPCHAVIGLGSSSHAPVQERQFIPDSYYANVSPVSFQGPGRISSGDR
jgi:hypothetical protein